MFLRSQMVEREVQGQPKRTSDKRSIQMKLKNLKNTLNASGNNNAAYKTRFAALSVLAGMMICGTAAYGSNDEPATPTTPDDDVAVVAEPTTPATPADDATPVAEPTTPATPADDATPVAEPTTPAKPDDDVTALADPTIIIAPAATQPSTPDVKTPEPKTPDVKTPDVKTPEPVATGAEDHRACHSRRENAGTQHSGCEDAGCRKSCRGRFRFPSRSRDYTSHRCSGLFSQRHRGIIRHGLDANGGVNMMVNKTSVILTSKGSAQARQQRPARDIVEVKLIGPSEMLLMARKPGSTQLVVWDDQEHSQVIDVVVGFDLRGLEAQIKEMFPKGSIKVESANGTIVLRGHVPDLQTASKAAAVAAPYGANGAAAPVLNFLEVSGGQQVMLQVRFAEVTRTVQQSLGFNAFITDGKFTLGAGNGPFGAAPTLANAGANATFPVYGGGTWPATPAFEYFVTALRQNGLLRILAEPNLTAISGEQASFLAGGEIPILVPTGQRRGIGHDRRL